MVSKGSQGDLMRNQGKQQIEGMFWDSEGFESNVWQEIVSSEVNLWQEIKWQKWKNYTQHISPYLLCCYLPPLSNTQMQIKCLNE